MAMQETKRNQRSERGRWPTRFSVAAFVASAVVLAPLVSASGSSVPTLKSADVPNFPGALVNHSSQTLYVLSAEKGARIKCQASCLSTWPPLLVKSSVKTLVLGAGVKGTIGFVARSSTMKQVTFNSFPVYTFQGDLHSLQSNGEGVKALGGTWTLVKAKAATAATTAFKKSSSTTTTTTMTPTATTTEPPTTTTTAAPGGGVAY